MNEQDYTRLKPELLKHNRRILGRMITLLEAEDAKTLDYIDKIYPESMNSFCIGITGPPGAGKSTLTNRLIEQYKLKRKQGKTLAVIAVDPSSPFTGGAFLGDRVRLKASFDNDIFTRSIASRGALGGLSAQTPEIIDLIEIAGFDMTYIETVGVGQSEVEIAKQADLTLVILQPETGDSIQALKAGLLEVGNIIVINKSDQPQAEEFRKSVEHALHLKTVGKIPPVFMVSAKSNDGVDELYTKINKIYRENVLDSAKSAIKKRNKIKERLMRRLHRNFTNSVESTEFQDLLTSTLEKIEQDELSFYDAFKVLSNKLSTLYLKY